MDKNKRGILKWKREGVWETVLFNLSGPRMMFSYHESQDKIVDHSLEKLTGVFSDPPHEDPDCLWCQFLFFFEESKFTLAAETRREKQGWILSLLTAHAALPKARRRAVAVPAPYAAPSSNAVWGLDNAGQAWYCERTSLDDTGGMVLVWYPLRPYLLHVSWGCSFGMFVTLSAGYGLAWGIGSNHQVYAYCECSNEERLQTLDENSATLLVVFVCIVLDVKKFYFLYIIRPISLEFGNKCHHISQMKIRT